MFMASLSKPARNRFYGLADGSLPPDGYLLAATVSKSAPGSSPEIIIILAEV